MALNFNRILRLLPFYRKLDNERARRQAELDNELARLRAEVLQLKTTQAEWTRFVPPGHFCSPIPSREEIAEAFARGGTGPPFPAVDLNEAGQFARLELFASYYPDQPFPDDPVPGRRFYLNNPSYGHHDAIMLYGMLREAQPRRVIEVGSGFSSAAMLDLGELVLGKKVEFTFIDPDMSRLRKLLREDDHTRCTLIEKRVQEVPIDRFAALAENDVLFIDSSHVSKIGSDVNRLYFDVLPALAPGVLIHIHDIAWNLEYPLGWFEEGRAWNEQYLLRAFLMNNRAYRIELFSAWLGRMKHEFMSARMPMCARGDGGQIWLRKLAE